MFCAPHHLRSAGLGPQHWYGKTKQNGGETGSSAAGEPLSFSSSGLFEALVVHFAWMQAAQSVGGITIPGATSCTGGLRVSGKRPPSLVLQKYNSGGVLHHSSEGPQLPKVITSGFVLPLLASFSSPLPCVPLLHPRIPSEKGHLDLRQVSV